VTPIPLRPLGRTGLRVTALGFGGAPLGNLFRPIPEADAVGAVAEAYAAGVRYFDTAPLYGHGLSERRMGEVLRGHPREGYVLSTKVGRWLEPCEPAEAGGGAYVGIPPFRIVYDYSAAGARRSLEASLGRLGLDRVDILYVHDIDVRTHGADGQPARQAEALAGAWPALRQLREEGIVRAIGLGVNEWPVCQALAEVSDPDVFLLAGRYTLLEQTALETFLPLCARRGIGIVIGGPYNSGILATGAVAGATYDYRPAPEAVLARVRRIEAVCESHDVPMAAAALQFPLAHPAVVAVIPGARTPAEVRQNLALWRDRLPAALWRDLRSEGLLRPDAPVPGEAAAL
jgi:D-threo-aldose 1-dehydrogenase